MRNDCLQPAIMIILMLIRSPSFTSLLNAVKTDFFAWATLASPQLHLCRV